MKFLLAGILFVLPIFAVAETTNVAKAKVEKKVFFVAPKDGATVHGKFAVKFGLAGMEIKPAGTPLDDKKSGHHHLIIDGAAIPAGQVVPKDEKNLHFGKGEVETFLTLPPGNHTLTMQFADSAHISFGPELSATIHVKVKK